MGLADDIENVERDIEGIEGVLSGRYANQSPAIDAMANIARRARRIGFDDYAGYVRSTAVYPDSGTPRMLPFAALGFAEEAGEVSGHVKRFLRGDDGLPGELTDERLEKLRIELGDALWYWFEVCRCAGLDPADVVMANVAKLTARQGRGTIVGEGDDR